MSSVRPRIVLCLAAVVGLIPFAGDMYLSSLPSIGAEFGAAPWVGQLTLTGFLLLLGIGQLVAGPVTDAVGRRTPLMAGLGVFTAGALLAVVAPSMGLLIAARVLQGVGGAISIVVATSTVRDHARGDGATRLYAVLTTITAVAPVIAPVAGGFLEARWGWRSVFVVLTVLGAGVWLATACLVPESLPQAERSRIDLRTALTGYRHLFGQRGFVIPLGAIALLFALLFAYIGGATYVYQGDYGVDPATFGIVFGATAFALVLGAAAAGQLTGRWGSVRLGVGGVSAVVLGAGLAVGAVLGAGPLALVAAGLAVALAGLGVAEPAFTGLCMSAVDDRAGQAAALIGGAQFVLGAGVTVVAGVLAPASTLGWTLLVLAPAVLALPFAVAARRSARAA